MTLNFEQDNELKTATVTVNRTRDFRTGDNAYAVGNLSARDRASDPAREARIVTHQRRVQAGLRALKRDPSRTTLLRRRFANKMKAKFKQLGRSIQELVVTDDVFGTGPSTPFLVMQERQAWRFRTSADKVTSYRDWLQREVDADILATSDVTGKPWTSDYVGPAYKKGMGRAYGDVTKLEAGLYEGTKEQFLRDAFNAPEMLSKIELIYTRAYEQLKGVTAAMSQQMSRILADGLAAGHGPAKIARALRDNVTSITNRRALVLARTEVIHAHAEGQLDGFEKLGVKEVGIEAELSTAGDDLVCERCYATEADGPYPIKEARGLVPVHPNCRCAWVPVEEGKRKKEEPLEYRLPEALPETPETRALLATEQRLRAETARIRKAYKQTKSGHVKFGLRQELNRSKEELAAIRARIDAAATGVKPPVTPTVPKPAVPKPPTPVTPAPAGTAGTKFATAEDYRQYLLQQVKAAKTPAAEKLVNDLRIKYQTAWEKYINAKYKAKLSSSKIKALKEKYLVLEKEYKTAEKVIKVNIQSQRKLLDEVNSKIGKCELLATDKNLKRYKPITDDILSWIPEKRKASSNFNWVNLESRSRKGVEVASYKASAKQIEMFIESKLHFAHEFGHHVSFQLKGFMRAQTQFFKQRTVGEKIVNLFGGVRGKKDKWHTLNKYAGRIYKDGKVPEVSSIGIEYLWKNPAKFAAKDPEWFNMIVSQLKGIPTKTGAKLAPVGKAVKAGRGVVGKVAKVSKVKSIKEIAKEYSKYELKYYEWVDKLKQTTKDAIEHYTKQGFGMINSVLVQVSKGTLPHVSMLSTAQLKALREARTLIKAIKLAVKLPSDISLYRGINFTKSNIDWRFLGQLKTNNVITTNKITSTSRLSKIADSFNRIDSVEDNIFVRFHITRHKSAVDIAPMSPQLAEQEVLFTPGTQFRVVNKVETVNMLKKSGKTYVKKILDVTLEEI